MGTASISAVRDGLKTQLATVLGLHAYDAIESQIESPAAVVEPDSGSFDLTMGRGSDAIDFVVGLAIGGPDRIAQDTLDGYLSGTGATGIKAAIEADTTLGGLVSFAKVRGWRNYGRTPVNGVSMWGADVIVEVMT